MTKEKFCRESRVIQTHRVFPFDLNPFGALFGGKLMSLIDDAASIPFHGIVGEGQSQHL